MERQGRTIRPIKADMDVTDNSPPTDRELTVITTHMNADFDALASMLAAQKLYPEALVVFPGSQEKNLRNFFIESMVYLFNMTDLKALDLSSVKRLVLVDTRQASRIGALATLLENPGLEIHIYDHHPPMANDIRGVFEVLLPTGSTVTILTEILAERGIDVSPDEATIMCLGIYEDTGSFTFSSTTEKDFNAAALLLSKGANLNIVSNLIAREINPEQVGILNDLIQAATRYHINGVEVVISRVTTETYVPDFAFLVQKLVKMENLDALFAIAAMEDKIHIVARSRIPEVDVGAILTPFGGGGHAFAAAATLKEETLIQAEQRLLNNLHASIQSRRRAADLMSSPAITVRPGISCRDAGSLLTRYNINALLVAEKEDGRDRLLGFITRQIIEKALYHRLGDVPVMDYMNTEIAQVDPKAELSEIQEKIIENKQRVLPVIDQESIVGVVTRTDLLNSLVRQRQYEAETSADPSRTSRQARTRNVTRFMKERLPGRLIGILESIGAVAAETGCNAYVVGGFVRDLFLYRPNEDIDIVVEGDGIQFAKTYAKKTAARIHTYAKFGTAVIIFPNGFKIDVASARMEYYKFPAALPTVEMSSIKLDLFRRDFTINTLAIHLNPKHHGTLIDFFSAQKDLKDKTIRILHNLSFVEDPTRVFRAVRFEQRFGFSIDRLTAGLVRNAVRMDFFKGLGGRRMFSELRLILEEENPALALGRLNDYDLLKVIHPLIKMDGNLINLFNATKNVLAWHDLLFLEESYMKWAVYFLALIRPCDRKTTEAICSRFELAPRKARIFCQERFQAERCLSWLERRPTIDNSSLYKRLAGFRTELLLYMLAAAREEKAKRFISRYFTKLRQVSVTLTGHDLKSLGFKPGPVYREILQAALEAKLNGKLKTHSDELSFARDYVRKP